MNKIIESPKHMFIIILLAGILGIFAGECFGQTIPLSQLQKAPGAAYIPYTGATGTMSFTLLSSLLPSTSGLVPYSGATGPVNLGSNSMSAQNFSITGTAGAGVLFMRAQAGGTVTAGSTPGIKFYSNNAGNLMWKRKPNIGTDTNARTIAGTLTANRNYTLPDKDITFAGLSDIPTYSVTAPLTFSANVFGITPTFVPYAGATASLNLGAYDLAATNGTFTGSINTASNNASFMNAASGNIGSLMSNTVTSTMFVKPGGTGLQFLKADGTLDNNTYLTTSSASSTYAPLISPSFTTRITTPIVYGSSASGGTLSLSSTTNTTKGKILFGTSGYDEVNNRLGIGNNAPAYALDVTGMVQASTGFLSNGVCQLAQINGYTNFVAIYGKLSNGGVILGYNAGSNITATFNSSGVDVSTGNITVSSAGKGLVIKGGANSRIGTATLSGGTVTVSNTTITANTRIFVTVQSLGTVTTMKAVGVTARVNGTSFTITSADNTDTSVVAWQLIEEN